MATDFETYYANNPVGVIDQNLWDDKVAAVNMQFFTGPTIYTPLIQWVNRSQQTGAQYSTFTELLEGDVNADSISLTAQYIAEPAGVDSRSRTISIARYGDKVQLHEASNILQMFIMNGQRDWRPILQGVLGNNYRRKIELLSRNAYLLGPKAYWTYAGSATNWATLDDTSTFDLAKVNEWNLRLGNLGSPIIPGESASAKLAILPPGAIYDFFNSLSAAASNEAALWRDASTYSGKPLQYELGSYKNIRFVEAPNDNYGMNNAVLYNCGAIDHQATVVAAIAAGDGSPDPETTKVDETWAVGQKAVTHYIQLDTGDAAHFSVNDIVTLHTSRTSTYGVANGVNPLDGHTVNRRVVSVDTDNDRIAFDRPIFYAYALTDGVAGYVTKGQHIGFILVLGSSGGIVGNVNRPTKFYTPKPIDDFESVWRFVWDIVAGWNIWEPGVFEPHFCSVSLPKPGGVISPFALGS